MSEPVAPALSAAGIVKTKGVDDVLDKVYESIDAQEFRNKFFEGIDQTPEQLEWQRKLLGQIAIECNKRLAGRVKIVGAHPELRGFGARFYGVDGDHRNYEVDFRYDDEDRMSGNPMDDESRVRASIDLIVTAVLDKRTHYLSRMGESA